MPFKAITLLVLGFLLSPDAFSVTPEVAQTMCQEFHRDKPDDLRAKAIKDCLSQMTIDPPARSAPSYGFGSPPRDDSSWLPPVTRAWNLPVIFAAIGILYFVPSVVAFARGKVNRVAILLLNIFLGWTYLGWVVALVWAAAHDGRKPESR